MTAATHAAYIDDEILAAISTCDLAATELHATLIRNGHKLPLERVYERLVHLEASQRVRLDAASYRTALWGAR